MKRPAWISRPPGELHRESPEVLGKLANGIQDEILDFLGLNQTEGERQ